MKLPATPPHVLVVVALAALYAVMVAMRVPEAAVGAAGFATSVIALYVVPRARKGDAPADREAAEASGGAPSAAERTEVAPVGAGGNAPTGAAHRVHSTRIAQALAPTTLEERAELARLLTLARFVVRGVDQTELEGLAARELVDELYPPPKDPPA